MTHVINRRLFVVCNKYIDNPLFAYWALDEKDVKDHLKKIIDKKFWRNAIGDDVSDEEINKMASNMSYFYEQWFPLVVNEYYEDGKNNDYLLKDSQYLYAEEYPDGDPAAGNNKNNYDRALKWKKIIIGEKQDGKNGVKIETLE